MRGGKGATGGKGAKAARAYREEPEAPPVPSFFGAASRKRVMEFLGQELYPGQFDESMLFRGKGAKGGFGGKSGKGGKAMQAFEPAQPPKRKRQRKQPREDEEDVEVAKEAPAEEPEEDGTRLPRDQPLWINVDTDAVEPLNGLAGLGLAVVSDGKKGGLYGSASQVIEHITGGEGEIQYHDDPNWTEYPAVGEVLKALAESEECYQLGVHSTLGIWAIGVGGRKKNRDQATKLALAAAIALHTEDSGEVLDLEEFPAMAQFVEEAKAAR